MRSASFDIDRWFTAGHESTTSRELPPIRRTVGAAALADPKLVIAVGACAISGGPFRGGSEVANGVGELLPVDLWVPGCPPHPLTILDGLLRLGGVIESGKRTSS